MEPRSKRRRSQPDAESDKCAGTWGQVSCAHLGALDSIRQIPTPWQYLLGVPKMTSAAVSEMYSWTRDPRNTFLTRSGWNSAWSIANEMKNRLLNGCCIDDDAATATYQWCRLNRWGVEEWFHYAYDCDMNEIKKLTTQSSVLKQHQPLTKHRFALPKQ